MSQIELTAEQIADLATLREKLKSSEGNENPTQEAQKGTDSKYHWVPRPRTVDAYDLNEGKPRAVTLLYATGKDDELLDFTDGKDVLCTMTRAEMRSFARNKAVLDKRYEARDAIGARRVIVNKGNDDFELQDIETR